MKNRILVVGNAPISKSPQGFYNTAFYFPNNSSFINSVNAGHVIGVIQDFTIDPSHWMCKKWGKIRKQKYNNYISNFRETYETILIGNNKISLKHDFNFNIIKTITHKVIVAHVIRNIPLLSLIKVLGLKGCVNYLFLFLNLKTRISAKYRPSSGYFISLFALNKFKNFQLDLIGFSNPSLEYIVSSEVVLESSPHAKLDSLIFNILNQKGSKFYL